MKLYIIFNPTAGKAALKRLNWIQDFFEKDGHEVTLFFSRKSGETRLLTKELVGRAPDKIIAAGGDGTISEVLDGLKGSGIPLGVIPFGTFNVFALETGIPLSTQAACELIKNGTSRKIHMGTANGRGFALMASVGFDAEVIYRLSTLYRRNPGKTMYFVEVLRGLMAKESGAMTVTLDDNVQHRCYGVLASNTKSFGGKILFCPDRGVEEENLEVCLFLKPGPLHMIKSLLTLGFLRGNKKDSDADLRFLHAKKITITTDEPSCHVQADGDIISHTPCTIEFSSNAADVIIPAQRAAAETDQPRSRRRYYRPRSRSRRPRNPEQNGDTNAQRASGSSSPSPEGRPSTE